NVNKTLAPLVCGKEIANIAALDKWMLDADGTHQKAKLGGNALLGVSLAYARALATSRKIPLYKQIQEWMGRTDKDLALPVPLMNILNGGVHADNGLAIQEFMIVPHGFAKFSEALRAGAEVFHHLKKILHSKGLATGVGDEGGFAPAITSNEKALELITEAVSKAGYQMGKQISLALDVAASSFYDTGTKLYSMAGEKWDRDRLVEYYAGLVKQFPIVSIEDGLEEDDWTGWKSLTEKIGKTTQLVGDDLFVTQVGRLKQGIESKTANAILIKVNQVGTLSETIDTMNLARQAGYRQVVSHRSGESEDVCIAHLAVGSGCGQIKTGSASRSERLAKYNELLRIEERAEAAGNPIPFARLFN
ncbi:phosphopyruvate hydratase, partial [bacterium]|nr:phosphopyruvate hydratase [bacterium]